MNFTLNKESEKLAVTSEQKPLSKDKLYSKTYLNKIDQELKDSFEDYEYNPMTIFLNGKQIDIF
jgi:hypothetical protein